MHHLPTEVVDIVGDFEERWADIPGEKLTEMLQSRWTELVAIVNSETLRESHEHPERNMRGTIAEWKKNKARASAFEFLGQEILRDVLRGTSHHGSSLLEDASDKKLNMDDGYWQFSTRCNFEIYAPKNLYRYRYSRIGEMDAAVTSSCSKSDSVTLIDFGWQVNLEDKKKKDAKHFPKIRDMIAKEMNMTTGKLHIILGAVRGHGVCHPLMLKEGPVDGCFATHVNIPASIDRVVEAAKRTLITTQRLATFHKELTQIDTTLARVR